MSPYSRSRTASMVAVEAHSEEWVGNILEPPSTLSVTTSLLFLWEFILRSMAGGFPVYGLDNALHCIWLGLESGLLWQSAIGNTRSKRHLIGWIMTSGRRMASQLQKQITHDDWADVVNR